MSIREAFVRLHRWVGLAIAGFLILAGLTGSVIAFNHELDEWLNPDLFRVDSRGTPQSPLDLAARAASGVPGFRVTYVPLDVEPGHALVLGLTSRTDARYLQLFLDPVTGTRLGEREWGVCCLSRRHAIPFIYSLHYTLHLPGVWGLWVMGIIGIVWAVDCFVGFYLTLPAGRRAGAASFETAPSASFWIRWKPAWCVKVDANAYRINFDLHRAIGLWFWAVLLTLAVSGVYLALPFDVVRPALSRITTLTASPFDPASAKAAVDPRVTYASIVATAQQEAVRRGWAAPFDVFHSPEFDLFGVGFGDHHAAGRGVPYLYFDAQTGAVRQRHVPGEGRVGDVFLQWMFPLHSGQAAGLLGRILISLTGVAVVVLSVTGVVIWSKKWRGRRALARRVTVERAA
jgi:uncharacterized iron-regulated membrane protein